MAFVPDKAGKRALKDLALTSFVLYLYYCQWRDHETGLSRRSFEKAWHDLELHRATAYRAQKELLDKHWIHVTPDGQIRPIMGSFAPVNRVSDPGGKAPLSDRDSQDQKVSLKIETGAENESQKRDFLSQKRDSINKRNIQHSPAELKEVDVELLRAREAPSEHVQQQLLNNSPEQGEITEEFLDHLQGLSAYRKRGVNVRDVLEKLMSTTGLPRDQVTKTHLRGWCNTERPAPQQPGGGSNGNGADRGKTGSGQAADRKPPGAGGAVQRRGGRDVWENTKVIS
jgi:hypothetical protein